MTHISVKDAAMQLDRLVRLARAGEEIILTEANAPAAKIVSIQSGKVQVPHKRRRAGSATGIFSVSSDFDAPLDDFAEYME
jgi:antitoxin (DNA-binding transcriptional repressor) of toxin-antitoxin stability system